jgi:hypothetical protein
MYRYYVNDLLSAAENSVFYSYGFHFFPVEKLRQLASPFSLSEPLFRSYFKTKDA